jgi:ArsR family transcriptional regulator, arsenate/arsenite/antimonite-responsive transcriptional repressor
MIRDGDLVPCQNSPIAPDQRLFAGYAALWHSPISPPTGGEACICDLNEAFELSQPTISHHMKVLHEAGLVDRDKRGVWVYYRVRPQALASLAALIGCPVP